MRLRPLSLLVAAALLGGCLTREELDLTPPLVVSVEPSARLVPTTVSFRLRFSEALNPRTVLREDEGSTVIIVERSAVTDTFIRDLNSPPLIESRLALLVPVELELLADDTEITVEPTSPLRPGVAYTLLVSSDVRDTSGNPLFGVSGVKEAFRFDFTTDDGPPELVSDDLGGGVVVPNRKYFRVTFNQAVVGLSQDTLRIEPADAAAEALLPTAEALLISPDRSEATLVLADGPGCERLAPDAAYDLVIGPGLQDDEGEGMEMIRLPFATGASCDLSANLLVGQPRAVPTDVAATVRFSTTKPSSSEVRYGRAGGPLDCLGALPCPVPGAYALLASDTTPPNFAHSVVLSDLVVGETYSFHVRAEDETGSSAFGSGSFVTAPLPEVSLNEIMGNPATTPDAAGEYVELVNYGDVAVDVSGWKLGIGAGSSERVCTLGSVPPLQPEAYLLLVPSDFMADFYGLDTSQTLAVTTSPSAKSLCGGITNSSAVPVNLYDADGRPVSTFAGYPHVNHSRDGRSVERVAPDAPDVAESFCYSRVNEGPTPLAANGVSLRGCE